LSPPQSIARVFIRGNAMGVLAADAKNGLSVDVFCGVAEGVFSGACIAVIVAFPGLVILGSG
jgi:hypothetical protein